MPSRHRIRLASPATTFHNGFPIGNGALGAMMHGRPATERIDLNIDTLWSGGPVPAERGTPQRRFLPDVRRAISARDFIQADAVARQMQGPGWTQSYQPLGWLDWHYAPDDEPDQYHRELDLTRAVATTSARSAHEQFQVESFVSAPAGVLVASARGTTLRLDSLIRFTSPHPSTEVIEEGDDDERWLVATGRVPSQVFPNYIRRDPAVIYPDDTPDPDGTVAAGMGFAVVVAVQRTGPDEVRLVVSAASGFRGFDQRPSADLRALAAEAKRPVVAATSRPTSELMAEHTRDYQHFFDRVDLDLSPSVQDGEPDGDADVARAELLFHFGRYLLISSSRPGTQAANLQGIWNGDVRPGWSCNYTTNINVEMNYWPAEITALPELHQPLFDLIHELTAMGVQTAARYYSAAGSAAHHNTDIWRFSTPVPGDPQHANWPSALFWLAAHVWDHLDFGAGDGFARETVLPVLRSSVAFALDMLVADDDSTLVMSPSTSPEHHFLTGTGHAATSAGAAMDRELVREVLTRYIRIAERLDADASDDLDLTSRARDALARLGPVAFSSDGTLLEWGDERPPREPGHRHLSHLYGLYPGTRITEAGTPHDYAAARQALQSRLDNGSGHTGWSQAWILCLAARLRDPELAEQSIRILLDDLSSASMLDLHPLQGWPTGYIFQIEGNFGAVAGLTELLVQSHEGAISLLKTLPASWHSGQVRGIRCRGGHRVDVVWSGGTLTGATVTTGDRGDVVLDVPASTHQLTVVDAAGHPVAVVAEASAIVARRRLRWSGHPHTRYQLHSADEPVSTGARGDSAVRPTATPT